MKLCLDCKHHSKFSGRFLIEQRCDKFYNYEESICPVTGVVSENATLNEKDPELTESVKEILREYSLHDYRPAIACMVMRSNEFLCSE